MDYIISVLLLIVGFVFLVKGADFFVSSSSSIARKFHVSPLVIGLTLVAFGTSLPELAVSFIASLTVAPGATADIAMGNVVGSNIANISLILGFTALANPIFVSKSMHRKEFPYLIFSSVLLIIFAVLFQVNDVIVWWEALILLIAFVGYVYMMIKTGSDTKVENTEPLMAPKKALLLLILGLGGVTLGGYMVTEAASAVATKVLVSFFSMDISKATTLVGLTIVAVGTSLPELVTSVVAAKKGENDIALGNLIGSCIFNLLFILGLSGVVTPLGINADVLVDIYIMLGIFLLTIFMAFTKQTISKLEGLVLVIIYAFYIAFIVTRAFGITFF